MTIASFSSAAPAGHAPCYLFPRQSSVGQPKYRVMNPHLFSLKTDTYLAAEWTGSRSPWSRPGGPFVTISREAGSGGSSLARILARMLNGRSPAGGNWKVFDTNLTPSMLRSQHLPVRIARFLPEDRLPGVQAYIGELVGLHPSLPNLVQKTNETIRQLAGEGQAIFVGRGANFAAKGVTHGCNVRLVASAAHRSKYLSQLHGISEAEARECNARCDAARRRYVRIHFDKEIEDPTAYDLVINTEQVPLIEAARLVSAYLQTRISLAA